MNKITTVDQLIDAWDKGDTVWSIELGGLGPGYEQTIQICAVEISRKLRHYKPCGNNEQDDAAVLKIRDEVVHNINEGVGGMSVAQVGQATWLAWQWCHNGGPEKLQRRAKSQGKGDDCIQISRYWPKAPEPIAK